MTLRTDITDAISSQIEWDDRLEKINGARRFAYEVIKAYLDGPNKKVKLFYDDVRVVIETDPTTGLDSVFLERKTLPSQEATREMCVKLSLYEEDFTINLDGNNSMKDYIESLEKRLQNEIDDIVERIEVNRDLPTTYSEMYYFLSRAEVNEMRSKFGFDKPAAQSEEDEDEDEDEHEDDRNKRIFSEKEDEICGWLYGTKSYESWCDDNYSDARNSIDIEERVSEHVGNWVDDIVENNYLTIGSPYPVIEWDGTVAEVWDHIEEDFDVDRPDEPPTNTYIASSVLDFYDTFIIKARIGGSNFVYSVQFTNFFLELDGSIEPFLNPQANVFFDIKITFEKHYSKVSEEELRHEVKSILQQIYNFNPIKNKFNFSRHLGFFDKIKNISVQHY